MASQPRKEKKDAARAVQHPFSSRTPCCARPAQRPKMAPQPKQKPLLPVLKEKKRYYAYRVYAKQALPQRTGSQVIDELQRLLGVFDSARAGLLGIGFDASTGTGVLRTSNAMEGRVRQAMLLVSSLGEQRVMLRPITKSGILRKAKQAK